MRPSFSPTRARPRGRQALSVTLPWRRSWMIVESTSFVADEAAHAVLQVVGPGDGARGAGNR